MSPVAVLVGAPGAGKSTVGKRVARALEVDFIDTDAVIVERAGKPISDIFVQDGEAAFRVLEEEVVSDVLATSDGVVALGGGAILSERTRALLAGHQVVWLRVGLSDAARRVGMNTARPLLLGNVRTQLKALMDARAPLYESVSTAVIDTTDRKVREIVDAVLVALGHQSEA